MQNSGDLNSPGNQLIASIQRISQRTSQIESNAWDKIRISGWLTGGEWVKVSNFVFTTLTDVTKVYRKGTKIAWGSDRFSLCSFGIVTSSSYNAGTDLTTVTMATNDTYPFSVNAYTYFSHIENPEAWPDWFYYTGFITYAASAAMTYTLVTTLIAQFRVSAQTVQFIIDANGTTGGVLSNELRASLPITASFSGINGNGATRDAAAGAAVLGYGLVTTTAFAGVRQASSANYTAGAGRILRISGFYPMA